MGRQVERVNEMELDSYGRIKSHSNFLKQSFQSFPNDPNDFFLST